MYSPKLCARGGRTLRCVKYITLGIQCQGFEQDCVGLVGGLVIVSRWGVRRVGW